MGQAPHQSRLGMFEIVGELEADPVRIDADEVILGRDPGSDVIFEDPRVSRRHARVWIDEHQMMIEDLGSKSGTIVNGRAIVAPVEIVTGDHIRLGLTELAVVWNPGMADTLEMPLVDSDSGDGEPMWVTAPSDQSDATEGTYRTYVGLSTQPFSQRTDTPPPSDVLVHAPQPTERASQIIGVPPRRGGPSEQGVRSEAMREVVDVAFEETTYRMPPWLRSLMLGMRRGRR